MRKFVNFNGKVASIHYRDPNPITLTKEVTVFFVDDGNGKSLSSEQWPELIGATYNTIPGNDFIATTVGGRQLKGGFLPLQIFEYPIKLKDLYPISLHTKRIDFLRSQGFFVWEPHWFGKKKPTITHARIFLKSRTWNQAYDKIPNEIIDRIYQYSSREDQDSELLAEWNGIIYTTNSYTINWEVHNNQGG